jgi:hypothetical protein
VWDFMLELDEPWEEGDYEEIELIDAGDKIAVHVGRQVHGRASGVDPSSTTGMFSCSATGGSLAPNGLPSGLRPFKPPGCGSRRCRGRTSMR